MAENSGISWTDHTFNPWIGCTKVSPACKNCYAERDMDHRFGKVQWGPTGTRVLTSNSNWQKPIKWNLEAGKKGIRYRVFCASLADVFEDWQGPIVDNNGNKLRLYRDGRITEEVDGTRNLTMDDNRGRMFQLIDSTPNLDWLLLTKRPENIRTMWPLADVFGQCQDKAYWPNVWLGTSVENQEYADKRIPELLKCRDLAPVLFLSCEPLLGPVDLTIVEPIQPYEGIDCLRGECFHYVSQETRKNAKIDWVIAGGESGPNSRPSDSGWFRSLRDQCQLACVPFHFKQWGSVTSGRMLDSRLHDGFPEVQHV